MVHLISNQRGRAVSSADFPVLEWHGMGSYPTGNIYFFIFSLPTSGTHVNEIKHDHSPEVIVVLEPRYDLSYKAVYIYSRSIALSRSVIAV